MGAGRWYRVPDGYLRVAIFKSRVLSPRIPCDAKEIFSQRTVHPLAVPLCAAMSRWQMEQADTDKGFVESVVTVVSDSPKAVVRAQQQVSEVFELVSAIQIGETLVDQSAAPTRSWYETCDDDAL